MSVSFLSNKVINVWSPRRGKGVTDLEDDLVVKLMDEDVWMIKLPSMTVDCSCDIFVKEEGKRFVQEKYLKILFLRE